MPLCATATNAARGQALFHVVDEATGEVRFKLVANNLPGDIVAAHIHVAPAGVPGPVVQPLALTPGAENGVIGQGSFTNPALVARSRRTLSSTTSTSTPAAGRRLPARRHPRAARRSGTAQQLDKLSP